MAFLGFAVLARDERFTRASEAYNVTQPTMPGGIRQLRAEQGVP